MAKKIAFIGNMFHQKTKSSDFFVSLLRGYDIDFYYGYPRNGCREVDLERIARSGYDIIILFQVLFRKDVLSSLNCKNIVIVPMYDSVYRKKAGYWKKYRNFKFISFSRRLHEILTSAGCLSFPCRYFPAVAERSASDASGLKGLFWQRRDEICWEQIKQLISSLNFVKLHIHDAVDPGSVFVKPSDDDIRRHHITFSSWFQDSAEYLKLVDDCNVFFCPRLHEGIGLSFLEAMARGKCVIAPDRPTMNEYIHDGSNGILYDPDHPRPLLELDAARLGRNAQETVRKGREEWLGTVAGLLDYIESDSPVKRRKSLF